jgi:GT2 family glycosyltransferase
MKRTPDISIVIPTVKNAPGLLRLLSSLSLLKGIETCEVLVVQNPPETRPPLKFSSSCFNVRFLNSDRGANLARNCGIKQASGKYIFFFDDDCCIEDPDLLDRHLSAHKENPWAFAVGGFYKNLNPSPVAKAYEKIQNNWLKKNRLDTQGECSTLLGGHMSLKRIENMPLFDESIIYGGTETEFFFRLRHRGFRFLLINSFVGHDPKISMSSLKRKARAQGATHARLQNEGLFIEAPWTLKPYRKSKYELVFEKNFAIRSRSPSSFKNFQAYFKSKLIAFHQNLYFYLENKERF